MLKVSSSVLMLGLCASFSGCASDVMEVTEFESVGGSGDSSFYAPVLEAGEASAYTYPPSPYGMRVGTTVPDTAFIGWRNPSATGFEPDAVETIRFSDFYDPDGTKGIKLIYVISSAEWCPPCRQEYSSFKNTGAAIDYKAKGVAFLGTLFQQNNEEPADYATGKRWGDQYSVNFPFVVDPTHKASLFATSGAIPFNFIIDARTMEMIETVEGYAPGMIEGILDRLLAER